MLGANSTYLGRIQSQREKPRLHAWEASGMTRVAACASCDLADACMGIPRRYVELHGDAEFHALKLAGKGEGDRSGR